MIMLVICFDSTVQSNKTTQLLCAGLNAICLSFGLVNFNLYEKSEKGNLKLKLVCPKYFVNVLLVRI